MTLIIAYMIMAYVDAHWIWYPVVFLIWLIHLVWHETSLQPHVKKVFRG